MKLKYRDNQGWVVLNSRGVVVAGPHWGRWAIDKECREKGIVHDKMPVQKESGSPR